MSTAPESRNEAILQATIDGTEYTAPPQSRIESLLIQLKEAIEAGGTGGDTTALAAKVNAIEAQLFSTIADVPTNTDSGSMDLYSKDLNAITTSGFYNAMTCTNAPATYCTLVVIGYYLAGYCTQIAADVTTGTLYTRTQTNGTWGAWSEKTNTADLAAVATSGAYSDLSGKPTLAAVATSGSYADLSGKPTVDSAISSSSTNAVQNKAVSAALANKANSSALTEETTARENADTALQAAIDGKASTADIYGVGTVVAGDADLDDIRTPGRYYFGSIAAETIANVPRTDCGGELTVEHIQNANRVRQTFVPNNTQADAALFYIRMFTSGYGGAWSPWYRFTGETVAAASTSSTASTQSLRAAELTGENTETEGEA